jgi:hypothetical protein
LYAHRTAPRLHCSRNVMEHLIPLAQFGSVGKVIVWILVLLAALIGLSGTVNLYRPRPRTQRLTGWLFILLAAVFLAGFAWICRFHYQIYLHLPLELPVGLAEYLNRHLEMMNQGAEYGLPLYDAGAPPRYVLPLWLENEKYYFWFMCYALLALIAHFRLERPRLRAALHILLAAQVAILFQAANPFIDPLPNFFRGVEPWFTENLTPAEQLRTVHAAVSEDDFLLQRRVHVVSPPSTVPVLRLYHHDLCDLGLYAGQAGAGGGKHGL